jgi:hypothetical protein
MQQPDNNRRHDATLRQRGRRLARLCGGVGAPPLLPDHHCHRPPHLLFNLERCKLDLLKLLVCTRDFGDGWEIDEATRFLFGNLRSFDAWVRTHRRVDSLGSQMRQWLHRDLIPVVEQTRFFTVDLPPTFPRHRRLAGLRLMRGVRDWVSEGATLEGDFFTDDDAPSSSSFLPVLTTTTTRADFGRADPAWLERGMHGWFGRRRLSRVDAPPPPPLPALHLLLPPHHYHPHCPEEEEVVKEEAEVEEEEEEEEEEEDAADDDDGYAQLAPLLALL